LSNTFNSLPATSANRYTIFNTLLNLANANDELDTIADAIAAVPNWLADWDIPATEKASLLSSIAIKLQESDQGLKAYEFFLAHLRFLSSTSLSGQGSSEVQTKDAAEKTIVAALDLANVFDFEELSQVDAVKKLEGEPIGQLLHIFTQGTTKDWQSWKSANESEIERLKLSASGLERKIRLLDLAALCSRSISSEVPYAEMAKTLEVDIDEVEVWVIDVIRVGLVSGKLSQISQSLRVYKSVYRSFDLEQWKILQSRLSTWEASISSILTTISGEYS
jgi:translation initiation factor 3 subunit M